MTTQKLHLTGGELALTGLCMVCVKRQNVSHDGAVREKGARGGVRTENAIIPVRGVECWFAMERRLRFQTEYFHRYEVSFYPWATTVRLLLLLVASSRPGFRVRAVDGTWP